MFKVIKLVAKMFLLHSLHIGVQLCFFWEPVVSAQDEILGLEKSSSVLTFFFCTDS